jgi:hypothetical protein
MSELIAGNAFDKKAARWKFYGEASRIFSLYLRPILTTVNFEYFEKYHPKTDMINMLKKIIHEERPRHRLNYGMTLD